MKDKGSTKEYILKQDWQFSYDRKMTYQKMRLFSYAYINDIPNILHADFGPALHRVKDSINSEYLLGKKFKDAISKIEEFLLENRSTDTIIGLKKIIVGEYRKAVPFVNKMPLAYETYSNNKLWKSFENYCLMEKTLSFATVLLFTRFEEPLTNALTKLLKEKFQDIKKVEDILEIISLPTKITPLDKYNMDMLKVVHCPKDSQEKLLSKLSKKYISWGQYDVNYNEATIEIHREKLNELSVGNTKKVISEIQEKYAIQKMRTLDILKSMKNDRHLFNMINLYVCYANYKDWKNFYREQASYKLKILLKEIGLRLNLEESLVAFLLEDEIKNGLHGSILIKSGEILKRKRNSAFLFKDGKFEILTDVLFLDELDKKLTAQDTSFVKGVAAYKGIARGRVKIIISNEDLHKLEEGDILVTGTTRPDYIQAMTKAAAFITNEGGLLSHAAIVARELKKPCIIGTKVATKVLKDGDLVEVDAEKGTVTILKRA